MRDGAILLENLVVWQIVLFCVQQGSWTPYFQKGFRSRRFPAQSVKLRPRFEILRDLAAPIPGMVCHFLFPNLCQPLFPYMYFVRQHHASAAIQEATIFQDIVRVTGDITRAISGILGNLRS